MDEEDIVIKLVLLPPGTEGFLYEIAEKIGENIDETLKGLREIMENYNISFTINGHKKTVNIFFKYDPITKIWKKQVDPELKEWLRERRIKRISKYS